MKILIADDDSAQLNLLEALLNSLGYHNIIKSLDPEEARQLVEKHRPDVCIFDIMMPGMTGGQLREELKQHPATGGIPVIFISGIISKKEAESIGGRLAGGDTIIAKPFSRNEISRAIQLVLNKGSGRQTD